jgi:hypothetical protein
MESKYPNPAGAKGGCGDALAKRLLYLLHARAISEGAGWEEQHISA